MVAVASRNIKFISHSDQGGRGDGVQVMVHRGYAYVGHGFSERHHRHRRARSEEPEDRQLHRRARPTPARSICRPTATCCVAVNAPSMWTMQIDSEGLLLRIAGRPGQEQDLHVGHPRLRHFAHLKRRARSPSCRSTASGRIASGTSAAATPTCRSISPISPTTCSAIVDMADPTKPSVVGKWWLPGLWSGGGETPTWPKGKRYALHHGLVAGNLFYGAWRDGGLTILDVADRDQAAARRAIATGIRRSAAAPIRRCRCPIATCW